MRSGTVLTLAASTAAVAVALVGCSPIVALEPAEDAASPDCANVTVRLPDEIGGLAERETNAQATGAWGDPTAIILHCGLEAPAPTSELPCETVGDVDWLIDGSEAPNFVFTTYGRSPAVSVAIDNTVVAGRTVLEALETAVATLPETGSRCIGLDEAFGLSDDSGLDVTTTP